MSMPRLLRLGLVLLLPWFSSCGIQPVSEPRQVQSQPPAFPTGTEYYRPGVSQSPGYVPRAVPAPAPSPVAAPRTFAAWKPSGPAPSVRAGSFIVIDADSGALLASRNANKRRHVASTQKLLTALCILRDERLDGRVTVAASDTWVEPSKLYLKTGQTYTRRELLRAMLVKSANDVANVLARDSAGSTSAFATRMNAYARSLGCRDSNFKNAHGLTAGGQYSTAADVSRIARAAWKNRFIRSVVSQRYETFRYSTGNTKKLENTNKCLARMSSCNGMKTGYTSASGRCLVSSASYLGRNIIVVQLGTTSSAVWNDGIKLMRWGVGLDS